MVDSFVNECMRYKASALKAEKLSVMEERLEDRCHLKDFSSKIDWTSVSAYLDRRTCFPVSSRLCPITSWKSRSFVSSIQFFGLLGVTDGSKDYLEVNPEILAHPRSSFRNLIRGTL